MKKPLAPKRKCKFNEDWKRDFAWIAKLPDCGMAQCNLYATDYCITPIFRVEEIIAIFANLNFERNFPPAKIKSTANGISQNFPPAKLFSREIFLPAKINF